MKIRTGDTVVVVSGKDKGKTGQVLRVLASKGRVVVADINIRTRHMRKSPQRPGEIVKYEASIDASNVMLVDPKTKKRTRVGYKKDEKGKKRVAKASGEEIKKAAIAKKRKDGDDGKDEKDKKREEMKNQREGKTSSSGSSETSGSSESSPSSQSPKKKSPFWKKMGFGADAMQDTGDTSGTSRMQEDHSVPDQSNSSVSRSSQRGS